MRQGFRRGDMAEKFKGPVYGNLIDNCFITKIIHSLQNAYPYHNLGFPGRTTKGLIVLLGKKFICKGQRNFRIYF